MDAFDAVVVGGGPAGATAADDLASAGHRVLLLDKAGRIKPCGGAVPPRLIRDFAIPQHILKAHVTGARMIAPSERSVDMPIDGGYVGMVDRDEFDEFLRARAASHGAERRTGTFERIDRASHEHAVVVWRDKAGVEQRAFARAIIGADGARSKVAREAGVPKSDKVPCVFAYHEIVRSPAAGEGFDPARCDVYYQGKLSPDFYAWVFPHGETTSIGVGSARKGFSLRGSVERLRQSSGLAACDLVRGEGAPIPLKPLKTWDNGRDVIVIGDAAGVVAPASGEGIYYAMYSGRLAAEGVSAFLATGEARELAGVRKRFMKAHGRVFMVLGIMQWFWYRSDALRERFVKICKDPDVQRLTWEAYMNKELVRRDPMAHVRVFFKDLAHLFRLASPS